MIYIIMNFAEFIQLLEELPTSNPMGMGMGPNQFGGGPGMMGPNMPGMGMGPMSPMGAGGAMGMPPGMDPNMPGAGGPMQQPPPPPTKIKTRDVWSVLEKALGKKNDKKAHAS